MKINAISLVVYIMNIQVGSLFYFTYSFHLLLKIKPQIETQIQPEKQFFNNRLSNRYYILILYSTYYGLMSISD